MGSVNGENRIEQATATSPAKDRIAELRNALAEKVKALSTLRDGIRSARKQRGGLEREVVAIQFAIEELKKITPEV